MLNREAELREPCRSLFHSIQDVFYRTDPEGRIVLNEVPHVLALSLVITKRKRAEAELLKALARDQERSEFKTSFVSTVSHEFRTPLGIILSSSEIPGRYLMRLKPEQREEHPRAIHRSVKRMVEMMEEVLLPVKAEAGRMECRPAPLDLADFCRQPTDATSRRSPA